MKTTTLLSPEITVAELAVHVPGAARLFERTGIDFCCGGNTTLGAACRAKGLDTEEILAALSFGQTLPEITDARWQGDPIEHLIQHIVEKHHGYVRAEVPRIEKWLEKVIAAHGERHPELLAVRHAFQGMAGEMAQHMAKEELILFPAIRRLAAPPEVSANRPPAQCFETLAQPVRMMMIEHEHSGRDLAEMREASGDYMAPPDACATYRALYQGLAEFESDMHRHVHLENNILFPRALALEEALKVARVSANG